MSERERIRVSEGGKERGDSFGWNGLVGKIMLRKIRVSERGGKGWEI